MQHKSTIPSFLEKTDKTLYGFILGMILPMLMFYLYYLVKFSDFTWEQYVVEARDLAVLPSFIKVSVFINLPVFFLFNLLKQFNICKGIFYASLLYILAMLLIKYVL